MDERRLRELGIPDEYTARHGTEPHYMHVREDGKIRKTGLVARRASGATENTQGPA